MKLADFCQEHLALAADFWWLHDYERDVVEVCDSVQAVLGYASTELTKPDAWYRLVHEHDLAEIQATTKQSATQSFGPQQARLRFRTRQGEWRTMLCRMKACMEDGLPSGLLGIARHIDDVVAIEAEMLQRNEDLAQVASVLSHDFRGPARHISGCIDRVVEQLVEAEATLAAGEHFDFTIAHNWSKLTKTAADRLGRMIEDISLYSRAGVNAIRPEDIDAADVVADVLRDYADRIAERNVRVRVTMLPVVRYDPTMLYLLLANLVSNAIKFSKPDDPSPLICIDGRSTVGDWVAIAIRDDGIGFPPSQRERILEMGFRLHHESEFPGFGYGLAFVKRILHRCGGGLGVRSKVGEGSEFVLKLPAGKVVRS